MDENAIAFNRTQLKKFIEDLKEVAEKFSQVEIEMESNEDKISIVHGSKGQFYQTSLQDGSNGVSYFLIKYYKEQLENAKNMDYHNFTINFSSPHKDNEKSVDFLSSNTKCYVGTQINELINLYNNSNKIESFEIKKQVYLILVALYKINLNSYEGEKLPKNKDFLNYIYNAFVTEIKQEEDQLHYNFIGISISTIGKEKKILPIKLKINFSKPDSEVFAIDYANDLFQGNLNHIEDDIYKFKLQNKQNKKEFYDVILRKQNNSHYFGTFQGLVKKERIIRAGRFIVTKSKDYNFNVNPIKLFNNDNLMDSIEDIVDHKTFIEFFNSSEKYFVQTENIKSMLPLNPNVLFFSSHKSYNNKIDGSKFYFYIKSSGEERILKKTIEIKDSGKVEIIRLAGVKKIIRKGRCLIKNRIAFIITNKKKDGEKSESVDCSPEIIQFRKNDNIHLKVPYLASFSRISQEGHPMCGIGVLMACAPNDKFEPKEYDHQDEIENLEHQVELKLLIESMKTNVSKLS